MGGQALVQKWGRVSDGGGWLILYQMGGILRPPPPQAKKKKKKNWTNLHSSMMEYDTFNTGSKHYNL